MQWPFPSVFYPSGQGAAGKKQIPLEFLAYPSAHTDTTVSNIHPPFPSVSYPVGHYSFEGGGFAGSIGTQFPRPSGVSPLKHFEKATATDVVFFRTHSPFPAETNPEEQVITFGGGVFFR